MQTNEEINVSPGTDGYRMMDKASKVWLAVFFVCVLIIAIVPKEGNSFIRLVAFGIQMLLAGIVIGNQAHIWRRPKLAPVRETKD